MAARRVWEPRAPLRVADNRWIPAFAGMTVDGNDGGRE
jgi:hypothetical protein